MWNTLTVAYVVIAVVAGGLVGAAALLGLRLAARYPEGPPLGCEREPYDRAHALVVTLASLGVLSRLALLPLWFWALSSLVPLIPGGMCLAAVHHLGGVDAWLASALKVVVPALLLVWYALERRDRAEELDALRRQKLLWLVPVLIAVAAETAFDLRFLGGLELGPSPCCMTLFDAPAQASEEHRATWWPAGIWGAGVAVVWVAAGLAARGQRRRARGEAASTVGIRAESGALWGSAAAALGLLLALHGRLGAELMHMPSHTCIFCAVRLEPEALLALFATFVGAWLAAARVTVARALREHDGAAGTARLSAPALWTLVGAVAIGCGLLL